MSIIINSIYKLLNATIGSNLEALFAGKTPNIKPIDPEMIMVEKVVVIPTDAGSGVIRDKRKTQDKKMAYFWWFLGKHTRISLCSNIS